MSIIISRTMTSEAEGYSSSVAGVDIEAVRAGPGSGPSEVLAAVDDRFTFTSSKVGFPMMSRATIGDGMVVAGYIRKAGPGSRWCELDLEPGSVLIESERARHVAHNQPGLEFEFAITDRDRLGLHADVLGVQLQPPRPGDVRCCRNPRATGLVRTAFGRFAEIAARGTHPPHQVGDEVLRSLVHLEGDSGAMPRVCDRKHVDPRQIVHDCIDYAESVQRIPSISELCVAAHVSERCLRSAFVQEFDAPPTRYFRAWALERARRRLLGADDRDLTITSVAVDLGWTHLGRFAVRYREVYGESPSSTLRRARPDNGEPPTPTPATLQTAGSTS